MWQFAEACRGLKDACARARHPGDRRQRQPLQPDRRDRDPADPGGRRARRDRRRHPRTPSGFGAAGERVFLLGETREELSGSEWAHVVHGHLGGLPPRVDLAAEQALAALLADAVARCSCHQRPRPVRRRAGPGPGGGLLPQRDRGLGVGGRVAGGDAFVALFAESAARAIVTATTDNADRPGRAGPAPRRTPHAARRRPAATTISVEGQFEVAVAELRAAWPATLPAALG